MPNLCPIPWEYLDRLLIVPFTPLFLSPSFTFITFFVNHPQINSQQDKYQPIPADMSPQDPVRGEQVRKGGNELYQKGDLDGGRFFN